MTWTAILAATLWVPFIVGINTATEPARDGAEDPFVRPGDLRALRPWVHRAYRAHLNLLEQFLPMLAVVLIAHAANVSNGVTIWATGFFFGLRVAHAVGMITGWARFPLRPLMFVAGWICVLAVGGTIIITG